MSEFKEAKFKVGDTVYFFYLDDPHGRPHKIKIKEFKPRPELLVAENWYTCALPDGSTLDFFEDYLSATYTECRKDWLEYRLMGFNGLIRAKESELKKATTELNRMKRKRHDIKMRLRRMGK